MRALVFGNSHTAALIKAYRERPYSWDIDFVFVSNPNQKHVSTYEHGLCFDEAILPSIKRSFGKAVSTISFEPYDRVVVAAGKSRQWYKMYQYGLLRDVFLCKNYREDFVSLMERFASKTVFIGSPLFVKNNRIDPNPEITERWTEDILPALKRYSKETVEAQNCYSVILPPTELIDANGIFTKNEFKRFPDNFNDNHLNTKAGGMILDAIFN